MLPNLNQFKPTFLYAEKRELPFMDEPVQTKHENFELSKYTKKYLIKHFSTYLMSAHNENQALLFLFLIRTI